MNIRWREVCGERRALVAALLAVGVLGAGVMASPNITSAVLHPRIWNDCANSILTSGNTYTRNAPSNEPYIGGDGTIFFDDSNFCDGGWANRHMWRYSVDGMADAVFNNDDAFAISADVTITGPANTEAAMEVAPWWSHDVGGGLTVITWNGEIAAFGGRLPFYSFTVEHGITYTKGETVNLAIQYVPRSLTEEDPGIVKYTVIQNAIEYTSGWLAFDMGNPDEDPPYGLWGILNDARLGGYCLPQCVGECTDWSRTQWDNIRYYPVPEPATLALFGLAGLAMLRRRR